MKKTEEPKHHDPLLRAMLPGVAMTIGLFLLDPAGWHYTLERAFFMWLGIASVVLALYTQRYTDRARHRKRRRRSAEERAARRAGNPSGAAG
jgi:hypothetical protein